MTLTIAVPLAPAPAAPVPVTAPSGAPVGWRHGGLRPGPRVVVAVAADLLGPLNDHLAALPSLPWMRGRIDLVSDDALVSGAWRPGGPVDATLSLMGGPAPEAARTLLRLCARLGIVAGRGLA